MADPATLDPAQVIVLSAASATAMALTVARLVAGFHSLQQDDYSNRRFLHWLTAVPARLVEGRGGTEFGLGAIAQLVLALQLQLPAGVTWPALLAPLLAAVLGLFTILRTPRGVPSKKPLVWTGRAQRLFAGSVALAVLLFVAGFLAMSKLAEALGMAAPYIPGLAVLLMGFVSVLAAPFAAMAANLALAPVQAAINWSYRLRARRKLDRVKPMVVGITGSYGKTSTKYFAEALMESRFRVLKTRASFNTILGVCRAINEELGPEHQVLIVEMGAYRRGEIRDMARLTRPRIGVLTAIGPQHLERFGSIETIEKAKFELLEALPADGIAIVNNDDPRVRRLAGTLHGPSIRRYGVDNSAGDLDLAAVAIAQGPDGLTFTLVERDGAQVAVKTRLIGRHNVSNILAAAAVARAAGVSLREIAGAVARLQPVPHRLETNTGADGVTIIDDAYNSNPVGAFNALDALAAFATGRKVIVTPGMVELGVEQDSWNEKLGTKAADVCDFVILVGSRQTAAIRRGLDARGFAGDRVVSARNLNDGLEALKGIVRTGDVVLFENDLPDLYDEE